MTDSIKTTENEVTLEVHAEVAGTHKAVARVDQQRRKYGRRSKQRGVGDLLNISLAALVVAIGSIASYYEFFDGSTDAQSGDLTTQLTAMVGKISNDYGGDYSTISNAVVIANGYLKNKNTMKASGSTITTKPGNGTLSVTPGQLQVANDAGTYTLTNLPDSVCTDMVNQLNSIAGQLSVNSTVVKPINGSLNPSLISCTTGQNTIVAIAD